MTRTALIIEDDALIAFELEDIVHAVSLRVIGTAATEDDAVAGAEAHRPDLLLVDVRLAKGNGISAVARILTAHDARVVYVTGNRNEVRKHDAAAICVNKPFNRQTIEQAIRSAFGGAGGAGPSGGDGGATRSGSRPPSPPPGGRPPGRSSRHVPKLLDLSNVAGLRRRDACLASVRSQHQESLVPCQISLRPSFAARAPRPSP
jgi:DNA-binding response OmpR family regulator